MFTPYDTVIVGLGQTGLACLRFLTQLYPKQRFAIVDTRQSPPHLTICQKTYPTIPIYLGELPESVLLSAKQIVVSPGLPLTAPIWAQCRAQEIAIIGDVELFAQHAKAPIIGITGSNGKGTVTTLVTDMINAAGQQAIACGNIGYSVLDALLDLPTPDWYVAELSSFQLLSTYSLQTTAAVILNLSPDHLDYHHTMTHYRQAKQRIYHHCQHPIINMDAPDSYQDYTFDIEPIRYGLSEPTGDVAYGVRWQQGQAYLSKGNTMLLPIHALRLVGQHNWLNSLAAIAIADCIGLPQSAITHTLTTFTGLPHRCQWVAEAGGITWYNDSKGTNVAATIVAIEAVASTLTQGRLILLMGGQAKGADFAELIPMVSQHVHTVYVFGEDAQLIATTLGKAATVVLVADLATAVQRAWQQTQPGDSVLLSPACASFDMFANFIERGERFEQLVKEFAQ